MTVALAPDLSGLLGRTGHTWPDADEDALVAAADGWHALAGRLATVRDDHDRAAREVLARNSGEAITAFGDRAADLDGSLLRLVEHCARAEGLLMTAARAVRDAKSAILDALDGLARGIERAERDLADIPLVGGALAGLLEEWVEPLVVEARRVIGGILDATTDVLFGVVLPGLDLAAAAVKSVAQNLRKLLHGEPGADWPTVPSRHPNPANVPRGIPAQEIKGDSASVRGHRLENEAARTLAQAGYDVEQIRETGHGKTADYLLEGRRFDCYAPTNPRPFNVWSNVKRYKIENNQTDGVIINLDTPDAQVGVDDLRRQFQDHPIPGLTELKVIAPGGAIIDVYP